MHHGSMKPTKERQESGEPRRNYILDDGEKETKEARKKERKKREMK